MAFTMFFLFAFSSYGNVKIWSGSAGDGLWATAANWNGNTVPVVDDDILLDQSVLPVSYIVALPDYGVTVKTLHIAPASGFSIRLIIPVSNKTSPAFSTTGPGYSILLEAGAVLENACGIASGESLMIEDSIRINNGGKYIHRTRGAHANSIVGRLSAMPGTELGIFEFDVPRSSYTLSVSNRVYGTLSLSAATLGAAVNYTGNGSNPLTIRGDLRIAAGVTFGVDLGGVKGNIDIDGDYVQEGGVFNLSSGAGNTTTVRIAGNLIQSAGSDITETNSGLPMLELNGHSLQVLSMAGTISNQVGLRMNNHEGALLLSPLALPYKLELIAGKITTSATNPLTLQTDCSVNLDSSTLNDTYIDGPLRKEGLNASPFFLFPVGKNGMMRWLELKQATGNFTVEYQRDNPHALSSNCNTGIDHVSSVEYWTVSSDALPDASAEVELSYILPASGSVTDPAYLNIARLENGSWDDAGHTGITGDFTGGSVVSKTIHPFTGAAFTLASTVNLENPLPIALIEFSGRRQERDIVLSWKIDLPEDAAYFEIWRGTPDHLTRIDSIRAFGERDQYYFSDDDNESSEPFYQLRVVDKTGISYLSRIIEVRSHPEQMLDCKLFPNPVEGVFALLQIHSAIKTDFQWKIVSMSGQTVQTGKIEAQEAADRLPIPVDHLSSGMYSFCLYDDRMRTCVVRFLKK